MKTFFYEQHAAMGAKFVDFASFKMPVQYTSVLQEHECVRKNVGIFDISHMGRVLVEGERAAEFLDFLATNKVQEMPEKKAIYTVFCHEDGGSVDDSIIYRHSEDSFSVIVNASNRNKDLQHLQVHAAKFKVTIRPAFSYESILAIQGPQSKDLLKKYLPEVEMLKFMQGQDMNFDKKVLFVSRTGYTGELGYEIYGANEALSRLWRVLFADKEYSLKPIGLGARDLLRLEMGFALYGHELTDDIAPIESIASWVVKFDKDNFLGKEALEEWRKKEDRRYQYGVILDERAIAREQTKVFINGEEKGIVTSGSFSPSLQKSIAIIMVSQQLTETDQIQLQIRNKDYSANLKKLPFLDKK